MEKKAQDQPNKIPFWWFLRRKYIHRFAEMPDIRYRGPLSYRHFRIIAWVTLIIASIGILLQVAASTKGDLNAFGSWPEALRFFSTFTAPLFLIAAFSLLLNAKDGYRRLIVFYGGLTLLVIGGFFLTYQHYLLGLAEAFSPENGRRMVDLIFYYSSTEGFFAFNIFLDLFLCSLVTFFLNYTPTKYFQGRLLFLFRSFAALPALYEIVSIVLKILSSCGAMVLSPYFFPFLTAKAPLSFLVFFAVALFMKNRKKHFLKNGSTPEDYAAFERTNVNSFQFAVRLSLTILIAAMIDAIAYVTISSILTANATIPEGADAYAVAVQQFNRVYNWGFGQTVPLIFIIPLVLLFDYKKSYQNAWIDLIIPVSGIIILGFVFLEGGFQILTSFLWEQANQSEESSSLDSAISALQQKIHK